MNTLPTSATSAGAGISRPGSAAAPPPQPHTRSAVELTRDRQQLWFEYLAFVVGSDAPPGSTAEAHHATFVGLVERCLLSIQTEVQPIAVPPLQWQLMSRVGARAAATATATAAAAASAGGGPSESATGLPFQVRRASVLRAHEGARRGP